MSILIISASMRGESQSLKVAKYLKQRLINQEQEASILDLHEFKLPLFDNGETKASKKEQLQSQLEESDGYIFVSPEWHGMMSHGLINMLLFVGNEMAHKPVMLVGVSSGRGGTYPVAQMRLMGHKNRHYVISPENLIVGGVVDVLNDQKIDKLAPDYTIKMRAEYALKVLVEYSIAMKTIRDGGVIDMSLFPNGV